MKPLYQMCYLESSSGFNNVINNQIKSLRDYIQGKQLGELSFTMNPDQTKGILIFTPANESIALNGYTMYIDAICNELQMDNGMYYQASNESSEYDFSRFKNEVALGIPHIISTIDQITGNTASIPQIHEVKKNDVYSEGVEAVDPIPNSSKVDLQMIYTEILNLKDIVGELTGIVKDLSTNKENPNIETAIPEEQIPDTIKDAGVNPNTDTAAAEVATPNDASVPDNNIANNQPPQTASETVIKEETAPNPNVTVLDNEAVNSTTGTESMIDSEINEIRAYIESVRGQIAGLEDANLDSAEIAVNNYIISNVQSTPSHILRLFVNYNFMETLANNSLIELDRVTHVRRKLHTNQLV